MKCVNGNCHKRVTKFEVTKENAIIPSDCEIGDLRKLFSYFQYRAPNIDSLSSPLLEIAAHERVLREITAGKDSFRFCHHNAVTEDELSKIALNGPSLCSWCKRFLCKRMTRPAKRDPLRRETDLECLLRHLRNAIAHGHVYILHGGNHISVLFEDTNDQGNITARIICCQADLRKWRNSLENAINAQAISTNCVVE